jgi:multidrug efflux pump subunit AcrB
MSTLVAEVYGPDPAVQTRIAEDLKKLLKNTPNVVDVDWQVEADQTEYVFNVDKERAALAGISSEQVVGALNMSLHGQSVSTLYDEDEYKQVGISLRLSEKQRSSINDLEKLKLMSKNGTMVPVGDIVDIEKSIKDKSIYRKNQKRVVYVTADVAGELESPVYAMLDISEKLNKIDLPKGYSLNEYYEGQPDSEANYGLKWDGEWQITYEVFRDLGTAFAVVLIIIYMLIVGWFQNTKVPFVMMIAIPLSLVGIILGHLILGAFFTATSMIGMIALAGIMVRNSILLIDFVNLRLAENVPLKQAVIEAGAVRTIPILLTAGTVVIGAFVILFDPIFQGLAISLMGGTIASTVLTLIMVPLIYYMSEKKRYEQKSESPINPEEKEENDTQINNSDE